jgi:predicted SprT family Zn-dependent metalloprotease
MDIQTAEKLAKDLMNQHLTGISTLTQVGYPGTLLWKFQWNTSKRIYGQCQDPGNISLSMPLVKARPEEEVRNTILHEIAHALAGIKNGHNWQWKAACMRLGIPPVRCVDKENPLIAPYTAKCKCGITHKFWKWVSRRYYCKKCKQPLEIIPNDFTRVSEY